MGYVKQEEMTLPRDNTWRSSQVMMTNLRAEYASLDIRLTVLERSAQGPATNEQIDRRIGELAAQLEQIGYRLNDHQARLERIRRVWLILQAPWRLMRRLINMTPFTGRPTWLTNLKWEGVSYEAARACAFAKSWRRE
jgi:hypothetical protein